MITHSIWAFTRIGALFMAMPVIGAKTIPVRVRVFLTLSMTFLIVPTLKNSLNIDPISLESVLVTLNQILIGLAMGLILHMFVQLFVMGGQIIAMQSGLGFASLVDPQSGATVPVLSQFYLILVTLVFLILDGHHAVIKLVIESFSLIPIATKGLNLTDYSGIAYFGAWMFKGAVALALPAVVSMLLVNLSFGVMTRAAPQLNIFTIGFPITLTIGLVLVFLTSAYILPFIQEQLDQALNFMHGILVG